MDHHCFVIANCVGKDNLRLFLQWLGHSVIAGVTGAMHTLRDGWEDAFVVITAFIYAATAASCVLVSDELH